MLIRMLALHCPLTRPPRRRVPILVLYADFNFPRLMDALRVPGERLGATIIPFQSALQVVVVIAAITVTTGTVDALFAPDGRLVMAILAAEGGAVRAFLGIAATKPMTGRILSHRAITADRRKRALLAWDAVVEVTVATGGAIVAILGWLAAFEIGAAAVTMTRVAEHGTALGGIAVAEAVAGAGKFHILGRSEAEAAAVELGKEVV